MVEVTRLLVRMGLICVSNRKDTVMDVKVCLLNKILYSCSVAKKIRRYTSSSFYVDYREILQTIQ